MTKRFSKQRMPKVIRASSDSSFVKNEVFSALPKVVPIKFSLEFNDDAEQFIAVTSPKYPGIITEARSMKEAYANIHDAILTYFEVPRACANAIKFDVVDEPERTKTNVLVQKIGIKQVANA